MIAFGIFMIALGFRKNMNKKDEFLKSQKILRLSYNWAKTKLHILFLFGICIVEKNSTLEQTLELKKQKI